ncbi:MAG: tRNA (mo5U34)-methyltransferase CmoB [Idiomarinaceae bacterium HL-53]|nr:MAG: tRNA (mo5U34)-methyltransferase CmoB [Idiomarinaceae bacterium HL-53]CUS47146.1 tRNA (mo5U34)-methyltransferase [Idiomarinaceae bacterium HL-53]
MKQYDAFYQRLIEAGMSHWLETLPAVLSDWHQNRRHGELKKWEKLVSQLPMVTPSHIDITNSVSIFASDSGTPELKAMEPLLKQLTPWRKGPFHVLGTDIDTEWRSDWKWDRVAPHISDLKGRKVLDIGCGSGYHLWRMKGAGADLVVGVDPGQLFMMQFRAIQRYMPTEIARDVEFLPLGIEHLQPTRAFDTVFTMGVLYHRRSPFEFLQQCIDQLKPGGELILETLVVDGDENTVLVPGERYAQMPNVWFIPSSAALCHWLSRLGLRDIQVVDETVTSLEEQRRTEWMQGQSLADFLDPNDRTKTIEGYPAPKRAVIKAKN